jgi:uncharacterized cupredoxin-like copper-binding protein
VKARTVFLAVLLSVTTVLLVACGGSQEESASGSEITVKVVDEFNYDPSTITVQPGQEVTITFENTGTVEHTFNVLKADAELEHIKEEVDDEEHLHESLLFDIHEVAPGASESETFTAPTEPGEYTIACLVPGHADAGMVGTLVVAQ